MLLGSVWESATLLCMDRKSETAFGKFRKISFTIFKHGCIIEGIDPSDIISLNKYQTRLNCFLYYIYVGNVSLFLLTLKYRLNPEGPKLPVNLHWEVANSRRIARRLGRMFGEIS